MYAIIVEYKGTPDPIVISWEHWIILGTKGQEDQEMIGGIGLLGNHEVKMKIPVWWI